MSENSVQIAGIGPAEQTHRMLRRFGVRWPRYPSKLRVALEIVRTDWLLRGPLDERLFPGTPPEDPSWMAPLYVIEAGGSALCKESAGLSCFLAACSLRLQRRYAPSFSPGFALACFAAFRVSATLDPAGSLRYARAAQEWMKRAPHVVDVRGELCLHAFVYSWVEPRSKILHALRRVADAAREVGDLEFAAYAMRNLGDYSLLGGRPLAESMRDFEIMERRDAQQSASYYSRSFIQLYALLQREQSEPDAWKAELAEAQRSLAGSEDHGIYVFWSLWVAVLCFLGEYATACELADRIAEDLFVKGAPGSSVVDFSLVRGLAAFAEAGASRGRKRRRHLRIARNCARRLRSWARSGPDFVHMSQFLEAEQARAAGQTRRALSLYAEAARRACDQGYRHHAALIHERRSGFLREARRSREASVDLAEACTLYREWGALGKARRLEASDRVRRPSDRPLGKAT